MSDQQPPEQGSFGQPAGDPPEPPRQPAAPTSPQPPSPAQAPPPSAERQASAPTPSMSSSGASAGSGAGGQAGHGTPSTADVQAAVKSVAADSSGFISALFDFTFTRFVTPILVRAVYLLATVALVATWLALLILAFMQGALSGLFMLVIGPIVVIIYLAIVRMTLEFYLSVVRMSEDIHRRLPQG